MAKRRKVGLVLSTGSAKALAHIGVIKVLEEENIPIDIVVGTSTAAIIGGLFAKGLNWKEIYDVFVGIKKLETFHLFFPWPTRYAFIRAINMERFIYDLFDDLKFSDLKKRFATNATNLNTGEEVVLNRGYISKAIRIAITMPTAFPILFYNGKHLVDGGTTNPFPIDIASKLGADVIIGSNLIPIINPELKRLFASSKLYKLIHYKEKPTLSKTYSQISLIMQNMMMMNHMNVVKNKNYIIINPDVISIGPLSFHRLRESVKQGEKAAKKRIKELRKIKDVL